MLSYCLIRVSARKLLQDLGLALGEVFSFLRRQQCEMLDLGLGPLVLGDVGAGTDQSPVACPALGRADPAAVAELMFVETFSGAVLGDPGSDSVVGLVRLNGD